MNLYRKINYENNAFEVSKDVNRFLSEGNAIPGMINVYIHRDSLEDIAGRINHYITVEIEPKEGFPLEDDEDLYFKNRYIMGSSTPQDIDDEELDLIYDVWVETIYSETELLEEDTPPDLEQEAAERELFEHHLQEYEKQIENEPLDNVDLYTRKSV